MVIFMHVTTAQYNPSHCPQKILGLSQFHRPNQIIELHNDIIQKGHCNNDDPTL